MANRAPATATPCQARWWRSVSTPSAACRATTAGRVSTAGRITTAVPAARATRRLRQALAQGGLRLVDQPQLDRRQRWIGSAALLRWRDPELGPVSRARSMPVAERSGLIHALGRWVREAASIQRRLRLHAGLMPPPLA